MSYQPREYEITAHGPEETSNRLKPPHLQRWHLFLLIFLTSMLGSQCYIFLQPAIYKSTATLLTLVSTDIDQTTTLANIQHVSIQQQILLSTEIMTKTAERMQQLMTDSKDLGVNNLKSMFSLAPESGTNLLHLSAQGPTPELLKLAVNTWIESYLQIRATFLAENTEKLSNDLSKQLQQIEQQLIEKRSQIDQFRIQNNILSTESADNEAHARLQGLNKSLNTALEEEIKAKAKLDALLEAISRNETVIPESNSPELAVLQQQAEKLRDQFADLKTQYTKEYIELNPNLRKTREQLDEIESTISDKINTGKNLILQEAENNYVTTRQTVITIKEQLQTHKQQLADYSNHFTEYQFMQQALLKLENQKQDIKQRLAEIDLKHRQSYPQVNVVNWASLPNKPISPNYLKESLLAFAVCLVISLLAVMVIDYLNREPSSSVSIPLNGIQLNHQSQATSDSAEQPTRVIYDPLKALSVDELPREMTYQEVQILYQVAEPVIKGVIKLIFNGLSLPEILSLSGNCFNLDTLTINIPGQRNLIMTESVAEWLTHENTITIWPSESEIKTLFCCAAIDSELLQPEQISIECLRFTYMLFLLRQGIRLADLTKILGPLSPSQLGVGASFSRANLPINDIMLDYFKSADLENS